VTAGNYDLGHDFADQLVDRLGQVQLTGTSSTKHQPVKELLATRTGVSIDRIGGVTLMPLDKQFPRGIGQALAGRPRLLVTLASEPYEAFLRRFEELVRYVGRLEAILACTNHGGGWTVPYVIGPSFSELRRALVVALPGAQDVQVQVPPLRSAPAIVPAGPMVIDDRIRRMVLVAIAAAKAVLLVGPPGAGKTTLLEQVLTEVAADPPAYGFTTQAISWEKVTAEEGWTAQTLIGGRTVTDSSGTIGFRPGRVLQAITERKWLFLDEANRAELDRIFGPLLTWLAGQEVTIDRVREAADAERVILDWAHGPDCETVNGHLVDPRLSPPPMPTGTSDLVYRAGRDWRLVGTYNAVDAQRVFRFGVALGRRFRHVPVPAANPSELEPHITDSVAKLGLPTDVASAVMGLYGAHHDDPASLLGPAAFLEIPDYVAKGLALWDLVGDPVVSQEQRTRALLCEAYCVSVGTHLGRLEDEERDQLGERIIDDQTAMTKQEWEWVQDTLRQTWAS
jgi:AAA domain (dynein-related subfamily)